MSAFRRNADSASSGAQILDGTRSSAGSKPVASSGLAQLDHLLGGGLAIGSVTLAFEDENSTHSASLCSYGLAEGTCCAHGLIVASASRTAVRSVKSIPLPAGAAASTAATPSSSELKIAWQYEKYLSSSKTSSSSISGPGGEREKIASFCHRFDLSRQAPLPSDAATLLYNRGESVTEFVERLKTSAFSLATVSSGQRVVRLLLLGVGTEQWRGNRTQTDVQQVGALQLVSCSVY